VRDRVGKKPTSGPLCPKCKAPLYFDEKGLRCTKCLYLWRPEKKSIVPEDPPPIYQTDEQE
jgi:hypothetical protein